MKLQVVIGIYNGLPEDVKVFIGEDNEIAIYEVVKTIRSSYGLSANPDTRELHSVSVYSFELQMNIEQKEKAHNE